MAGRQLHKLSARKAETTMEPGRHSDGGGLYLAIETGDHARRAWVFMYRERGSGRRRELGLGAAKGPKRPGLTLAEARTKAADARKMLSQGRDPKKERVVQCGSAETFGPFADAYLKSILSGFKGPKAEADWTRDIQVRCKPTLRKRGRRNPAMALFGVSKIRCSEYTGLRNTSAALSGRGGGGSRSDRRGADI